MSIVINLTPAYKQSNIILDENYNFSEKDTTDITIDFLNKLTPVQLILLENKIKQDIERNKLKKPTKIQIRYFSGPNTISLHINHNMKKYIYIIGESHNTVDRCKEVKQEGKGENIISFIDILTNMSVNNNLIVDIYVETHIDRKRIKKNKTEETLKEIYTIFKQCFEHTNNNPYHTIDTCRLIRTHYIDIRFVKNNPFRNIVSNNHPITIYLKNVYKLNVVNSKFTFLYFKNIYLPAILLISQDSKQYDILLKQLTKSYFKANLFYYLLYKFIAAKSRIRILIKDFFDINITDKIFILKSITSILFVIETSIMDFYTMARIFRKESKDRYLDKPITNNNIIIYTGSRHSYFYRVFLERMSFTTIFNINSKTETSDGCINLPENFVYPLFKEGFKTSQLLSETFDEQSVDTGLKCRYHTMLVDILNTFDFTDYIKNNTTENIIEIRTEQQISDNYDNYDLLKTNIINRITRLISDSHPIRIPSISQPIRILSAPRKRAWAQAQFSNSIKSRKSTKSRKNIFKKL